jgi:mRNA-degrading endonuclease YafQ of YafQ-DinJ toxin-antitoxin module
MLTGQEKKQIARKLTALSENPLHPSLRTKRVQGADGLFEASINMDMRVIWYYELEEMIILVDIGHHDILNDY